MKLVIGKTKIKEPDNSRLRGYRLRPALIVECSFCGHRIVVRPHKASACLKSRCKLCSDRGLENTKRIAGGRLRRSQRQQPSILRDGYDLPLHTLHGLSSTRAYKSWEGMMRRCYSAKHVSYEDYGGRGIRVCPDWHNPLLFYCDMGDRPDGWSIERADPDGDYSPENCSWLPKGDQTKNTRRSLTYRFPGLTEAQRAEYYRVYFREYRRRTYVSRGRPRGRPIDMSMWFHAANCSEMRREKYGPLKSPGACRNRVKRWEEFYQSKHCPP